jgi:ligand-binding sensor domain-containing protein
MSELRGTLYEDRRGNLWLGGNGGLFRLEEKDGAVAPSKIELNLPPNPSTEFSILAMSEGQDGSLWLATSWGLVRRLPDGREVFYRAGGSRTDASTSVLEDRAGRIWLGRTSGVYVIKPESLEELAPLGDLTVRELDDLAKAQSHRDWRASLPEKPGAIIKYTDLGSFSLGKFLYQTADGHVWISAGDGIIEYDGETFRPYTTEQGLLKGAGRIVEDSSGNLWLGWTSGLLRFDRQGLTTYDLADGLHNLSILDINETIEGKLYVVASDFSVSQFDGKGFQTIRPLLPPEAKALWTSNPVFQDHAGEWGF